MSQEKVKASLMLLVVLLCVSSSALATVTIVHQWSMGEDDPGATAGGFATGVTVDAVGGNDLYVVGDPNYQDTTPSGNTLNGSVPATASTLALKQHNVYGTWPTVAQRFFTDPNMDYNPTDPSNWGAELWVRPDSLPTEGQDGEAVLLNLGSFANPSAMVEIMGGQFILHLPGVILAETGIWAVPGEWAHLAVVNQAGTLTMFVNGKPRLTFGGGAYDPSIGVTVGALYANGTGGVTYARALDGVIDEVRIFEFAAGAFSVSDLNFRSSRASVPAPVNNQVQVAIDTTLNWTPGQGVGLIEEHLTVWKHATAEVIVGPDAVVTPPYTFAANLDIATQYDWQVDSVYGAGTVAGQLWAFQTVAPVTEPIADGLQLWLDVNAGLTLGDNDAVEAWQDQSPNGYVMTPPGTVADPNIVDMTKAPQYVVEGFRRQLPMIAFDGLNDYLIDVDNQLGITNDHTIFLVWSMDYPSTTNGSLFTIGNALSTYGTINSTTNGGSYICKGSGDWTADWVAGIHIPVPGPYDDSPGVGTFSAFRREGINMAARMAGEEVGSDVGTDGPIEWNWINSVASVQIGASMVADAPTQWLAGGMAEVIVYNRALTEVEVALMEYYLNEKWMLPYCSQPGQFFDNGDLNHDCYVNMEDFALLASNWLICRDPANQANCDAWDGQ